MQRSRSVTTFLKAFKDTRGVFFDLEPHALIVLNPRGGIERVNPAFERATGRSDADVHGVAITQLISEADLAAFMRAFDLKRPYPIFRLLHQGTGEVRVQLVAMQFTHGVLDEHQGFLILQLVDQP